MAILVISGLAIVPGYLAAFLLISILIDQNESLPPPPFREGPPPLSGAQKSGEVSNQKPSWPGVTILIAAYNEEDEIGETLLHIISSDYSGPIEVIVIDDGSRDKTAKIAQAFHGIRVISDGHRGKPGALNRGLKAARHDLVLSLDADTLLTPQAIKRLVSRIVKEEGSAVAGAVMVLNSHDSWLTRMQQWDYQMGIAAIKRSQAIWQNTSVAQGACSLFRKEDLLLSGGWKEMVGEDIVLTWSFLEQGHCVAFEPTALAFTRTPRKLRGFIRQRSRWARGMFEGLREHGLGIIKERRLASHGVFVNALFPLVDVSYTFAFLPGVVLALGFSNFALVGPITLFVIPLNLLVFLAIHKQQSRVFREVGIKLHKNRLGFILYLLLYQALIAPISLFGYLEEVLRRRKVWRASKST